MADAITDILILGGGIGGLTLGAILRQLNLSYKVLDRSTSLTPTGAGISLAPNALKVLDQLGLYEDILAVGQKIRSIRVYRNDVQWNEIDWSGMEAAYGYPVMMAERHSFHQILYRAAGGAESVIMDSKVVDIIDDAAEPFVTVILADGKKLRARIVVGADGIRSVTRRILAGRANDKSANTIRYTGRTHMSGITKPLPHLSDDAIGVGHWMLYDKSVLVTWPCPGKGQWFIGMKQSATVKEQDRSVWDSATTGMVNEVYGNEFHPLTDNGKTSEIIDQAIRVLASDVFEEVAFPSMAKGRVALIGDAAHSMTSAFGQGGCQSIEDAAVLADELQTKIVKSGIGFDRLTSAEIGSILATYAARREERVQQLALWSRKFAMLQAAIIPYGLGGFLRGLVFRFAPGWAWIWYLKWLYGVQPTVSGLDPVKKKA